MCHPLAWNPIPSCARSLHAPATVQRPWARCRRRRPASRRSRFLDAHQTTGLPASSTTLLFVPRERTSSTVFLLREGIAAFVHQRVSARHVWLLRAFRSLPLQAVHAMGTSLGVNAKPATKMLLPHDGEYMASDEIVRSSVWTNSFPQEVQLNATAVPGFHPGPQDFSLSRRDAHPADRVLCFAIGPGPSRPPAQRSGCVPAEPYPLAGSGKVYLFMLALRDSRP